MDLLPIGEWRVRPLIGECRVPIEMAIGECRLKFAIGDSKTDLPSYPQVGNPLNRQSTQIGNPHSIINRHSAMNGRTRQSPLANRQ
jgi:hypothetical protein